MRLLVRICGDFDADSHCDGGSGDEFVPLDAVSDRASLATCLSIAKLPCKWDSPVSYVQARNLPKGSQVFVMDQDNDYAGSVASWGGPAAGPGLVFVPFPAWVSEWALGAGLVAGLFISLLLLRRVYRWGSRVVRFPQRIRP